jgi:shikimate dehydrogenase
VKRACVIGWPVEHSRSPLIHTYWLKLYGISGAYEKMAVRPEELADFLGSLFECGFTGCNVTLPHKEAALRLAQAVDQSARAIGAANTLWLDEDAELHASNTDAYGFMANLAEQAPAWNAGRRPVVVLGAGGAARAIIYGLLEGGAAKILLTNRSRDRADALALEFAPLAKTFDARIEVVEWGDRGAALAGCGLLVNATSLGMIGKPPLELDLAALPADAVVADIVYSPRETPLLAAARARGNMTVDGLGMLLYQAVPGFERWFGFRPEVTAELRAMLAASLEGE